MSRKNFPQNDWLNSTWLISGREVDDGDDDDDDDEDDEPKSESVSQAASVRVEAHFGTHDLNSRS